MLMLKRVTKLTGKVKHQSKKKHQEKAKQAKEVSVRNQMVVAVELCKYCQATLIIFYV